MDAYAAFERDIPADKQDEIMTMMAEAAHDDSAHRDIITILERDKLDAINVRVNGIVTFNGNEHSFILSDGNWNGTVLEDWDGPMQFEHHKPTEWALQPNNALVGRALMDGTGKLLLLKWDAIIKNLNLGDVPRNYAYDRHFHPGVKIEKHYRDKAAKHGFVIVTKEEAGATRAALMAAE